MSFGAMKALFWNSVQVSATFTDGLFNVRHPSIALSTVTINFFFVRPIQQLVLFLANHCVSVDDCLPVAKHMCPIFERLDLMVHPAFDLCIGTLKALVNFCSGAYRIDAVSEQLLRRQVWRSRDEAESRLVLATVDAHVFQESYFPRAYEYGSSDTSYNAPFRSLRDERHVRRSLRIAICLGLVYSSYYLQRYSAWHSSQIADTLVAINASSFDNETLRLEYPRLFKG